MFNHFGEQKLDLRPRKCLDYATLYEACIELTGLDARILVKVFAYESNSPLKDDVINKYKESRDFMNISQKSLEKIWDNQKYSI